MPRSNELAFLRAKLAHAEAENSDAAVELRKRIRRLQDDVSEFRRGLKRKPY